MKLTIVTHNVVRGNGQGRVNYEIAKYALKHGVAVTLLADRVDEDVLTSGAQLVPIRPRPLKPGIVQIIGAVRMADRHLRHSRASAGIIHGSGYTLNTPHHVNTAHFVHGAWIKSKVHVSRVNRGVYGAYQWMYSVLNCRWELQTYSKSRRVIAVSNQVKRELIDIGVPAERVGVILNAVDLEEFRPGVSDRQTLGLPGEVPLALFVGDIRTPRKNLDTVLKALVNTPGMHLAVVGETSKSPYPAMAHRLNVSSRVHFLGFRNDTADIMRAVDLFVFPSRYETCSLVILEAIASGLPVITAATTGGAEVLTPDCGVLLDDSDDDRALASAMQQIMCSPGRRREMGQAARMVAEGHGWSQIASEYLELYADLEAEGL